MDVRPLLYFVTVARLKSFTRAGEHLHVSQPTISKLIRNLEDELGVTLLERSTKQVRLTDAGAALMAQAEQILGALESLTENLSDVMHLRKGTVRIGLPPMAGAHFFPEVLANFHAQYPEVNLRLVEDGAKKIEEAVSDGSLDLGVIVLPTDDERFGQVPFGGSNLMVVVSSGHPLADRTTLTLKELEHQPFILFREDWSLHDRIMRACSAEGFQPTIVCKSGQWDFVVELAAANLGIALLPETICRRLDPNRLRTIPLTAPVIPWYLAIIWRKDRYLSFAAREWLNFARTALRN
ncbi:MAG: ywbI [Symbiobacteriaceae bacterium]|nr:ywbI [Symbiobacteriaceae bacterium]